MKIIPILFISFSAYGLIYKPNQDMTPGSLCSKEDKDFKEVRYNEQIPVCKRNVSPSLKDKIYAKYQVKPEERDQYTIDHKISLFVGGSNKEDNLWPQPKVISSFLLEQQVFFLLNKDIITQKEALDLILSIK